MKKFRVYIYEDTSGIVEIEAENIELARKQVDTVLANSGVEGFKNYISQAREIGILNDLEEI